MNKRDLVAQLINRLEDRQRVMAAAAREATENATGDETRSEGKYDTRAIEAGYLAGAQQARATKLNEELEALRRLEVIPCELTDPAGMGALVETDADGETRFFLLAPGGGGETLEYLGCEATVLVPESPLYQEILGTSAGTSLPEHGLVVLGIE